MKVRSAVAQFVALILVLVPAFMADAPPRPVLAALYAMAGLLILGCGPSVPIPKGIGWAALLLLAASALAFLPASWFAEPAWRQAFKATGEISLGMTETPQPWQTAQGLAMLAAGCVFGLYLLCQPVNGENHLRLATCFTVGIGIYAGFSIGAAETGWRHPWDLEGTFGFLPNRNHVGTLLAMGAIAGFGPLYYTVAHKKWGYVLPLLLAFGSIGWALFFFCISRAAVPLLFAGSLLWVAGVAGRQLSLRITISLLALLAAAGVAFFNSKAPSKERIAETISGQKESSAEFSPSALAFNTVAPGDFEETLPFDFRLLTYKDTLDLIADHPVSGVGLGNYRYIFPQYRRASLAETVTIHADSSWLLVAAESGLPALAASAALVVLACLRLRGCRDHPSWAVRWSSACAVLIFIVHCFFDIPAHRTATLLPALFLAGLAFRMSKPSRTRSRTVIPLSSRLLFAASGTAFLVAAGWLAGFVPVPLSAPPTVQVENARRQVFSLYKQNRLVEAIDTVRSAIAQTPLASDLYFQWGALDLATADATQEAERLFATERILEPCLTATPLRQAAVWLPIDPSRSLDLFSDAMFRAVKQEKRGFAGRAKATYAQILQVPAVQSAELIEGFRSLAGNDPALILEWMKIAPRDAFDDALADLRSSDPSLSQWDHAERRRLFRLWHQRGNRKVLMEQISLQPGWPRDAWPVLAADMALENNYQQAWSLAAANVQLIPPERNPSDPGLSRLRNLFSTRKSPETAEMLAKALFLKSDWDGVMEMASKNKTGPVLRMASLAAAKLNFWHEAWNYLVEAIQIEDESFTPE